MLKNEDDIFMIFNHLTNRGNLEGVGVTISINGSVVTGNLISYEQYLESTLEMVNSGFSSEVENESLLGRLLKDALEVESQDEENSDEKEELEPPNYIHLKNAKVVFGSSLIPANGGLWRAKVDSLDGFMLGSLKTQ